MRILSLILLTFILLPVYAEDSSAEIIQSTDKGTINVGLSTIPSKPNLNEETKLKINFMNKSTNTIQEHVDYSIVIKKGDAQIFGTPLIHTAIGSVTIPYEFQEEGEYEIIVDVETIVFQPIPSESAIFTISIEKPQPQPKNGCLIATAAFGSELAPQVQFLREYRDSRIMTTAAGSSFLNVFNMIYYSFSPTIADLEKDNSVLQEFIRSGMAPLLGILQVAKVSSVGDGEIAVLTSGMIASSLIGAGYLWPVGLITKSARENTKSKIKIAVAIISASLVLTLVSILSANTEFMMFTTSILVLSFMVIGAMFSSSIIWKLMLKIRSTFL